MLLLFLALSFPMPAAGRCTISVEGQIDRANLIVEGRFVSRHGNSLRFTVIAIYKGHYESADIQVHTDRRSILLGHLQPGGIFLLLVRAEEETFRLLPCGHSGLLREVNRTLSALARRGLTRVSRGSKHDPTPREQAAGPKSPTKGTLSFSIWARHSWLSEPSLDASLGDEPPASDPTPGVHRTARCGLPHCATETPER